MTVAPPRPKMPPLNALRAFEAAARWGSISGAASELCVTPAAVAQQVKSLEGWIGAKLFKRNPQGIELTQLGATVARDFEAAFDQLGAAVQKLRLNAPAADIRIAALPSVAQLWLSPRLPAIRAALPETSLSVHALEQRPNLVREPFDLCIFIEPFDATSDQSVTVAQDIIFPVCAPDIAARLTSIEDLAAEVFLHDSAWSDDWKTWLAAMRPKANLYKVGPVFSLYSLALEECKNGAGVLMGHETLVAPLIASGQLAAPFDARIALPRRLAITLPPSAAAGSRLRKIASMLVSSSGS